MTEEEFGNWRQHPVTKMLFSRLQKEVQEKMEGIVKDNYEDPQIVKGYIRAYLNIVNMEYTDLYE